jgi:ArsR family metal-binding transcriptional regulator
METLLNYLSHWLSKNPFLAYSELFFGGILSSSSPCVLATIPLVKRRRSYSCIRWDLSVLFRNHTLADDMLLNSYKITRILPCIADPDKIRVIAEVSDEIQEVFPYLNAVIKGCIYNHAALTLTIRKEDKLITLHAKHVTLTLIEDEKEAQDILDWLKDLINKTYQKRDQIESNYSEGDQLKPSDIQKLLPGTNCRECRFRSCLAFAFKSVDQKIEIDKCLPLFSDEYNEKRKVLLEMLQAAGCHIPMKEDAKND